jgi:hypothetical protein
VGAKGFEAVAVAIGQVAATTKGGMTAVTTMTVEFVQVCRQAPGRLHLKHQQPAKGDADHAVDLHTGLIVALVDVAPCKEEERHKNPAIERVKSAWHL